MKKVRMPVVMGMFLVASLATIILAAERRGPGGPPPEIQACKNKQAGEACSFTSRDGKTVTAACKSVNTPMGEELSCGDLPKPPQQGDRPPQMERQ